MRHTLTEGQVLEQLDEPDQVASSPAAVAVKQIFVGVDVERRACFRMQGTQPHELRLRARAMTPPVVPLQVLQQRNMLFEPIQILAHGLSFPPTVERTESAAVFPGEDGGRLIFLRGARARTAPETGRGWASSTAGHPAPGLLAG